MEFKHGDILVRNNVIWINQSFIMRLCNISDITFRTTIRKRYKSSVQPCHRHHNTLPVTGKSWRWSKILNQYYYDLQYISNRKPTFYRDSFGDANQLIKEYNAFIKEETISLLEIEFNAFVEANHMQYLYYYVETCTEVQIYALAKACAALEFVASHISNLEITGDKIYKDVCAIVDRQDLRYLPKNYRILKEKIQRVFAGEQIQDIIKLPRAGNSNAKYFEDPVLFATTIKLRSMPQNYTNSFIIRKMQEWCRVKGRRVPSNRWFGQNIFESEEIKFLTDIKRYGAGSMRAFNNSSYMPLAKALFAGECWQLDATRVNIIEHKKSDKKQGFLFVIAVRDVYSGDILGHSFDYSENRWSVINAIKMAVENAGYLPYELVADRFPGHNSEEGVKLLNHIRAMGTKVTITHKATGKAFIERMFGTLQTVFMQDSRYYYGQGVKSSRNYAHRSAEYLKQIRKEAKAEKFGLTEAYNEANEIIERYRVTPLSYYSRKYINVNKSPRFLHAESDKPNVNWLEEYQISMIFGLKKQVTIKHDGLIKIEINRAEYLYKVDNYDIYKKEKKVILSYDMNDLNQIYLFKPKKHFLIHLGEAQIYEKPMPYGPQAEFDKIAKEKQRLKEIELRKKQHLEEITTDADADEVELLMGRHTNKQAAEIATTKLLTKSPKVISLKKAAGSEFVDTATSDDLDIDLDKFLTSKY